MRPNSWRLLYTVSLMASVTSIASPQEPSAARRLTIGVLPFVDATGGTAVEVGVAVGRLVQAEMVRAGKIQGRVVAPEGMQPETLDPEAAAALGRERKLAVMLIGTLLEGKAEESSKGGWLPAIRGQAARVDVRSVKARVLIQGDLISSTTGEVLASLRVRGDYTDRQFGGALYSSFGSWDAWDSFIESPMGKALRRAVEDLVKQIDVRAASLARTEMGTAEPNEQNTVVPARAEPAKVRPPATVATSSGAAPQEAATPTPGAAPIVPLRQGLTIVTAVFREDLGDYESTKVIASVTPRDVKVGFAGQEVRLTRSVLRSDLDTARLLRAGFNNDDDASFPGSTAVGTSSRVLRELVERGQATIGLQVGDAGPRYGTIKRIGNVGTYSALVNDARIDLPAIRVRGKLDGEPADLVFLNDPTNPLVLQFRFDDRTLDVIRIAYPSDDGSKNSRIAKALASNEKIDVYGIYFDFASDRLRPESDPVLQEIADLLKQNPTWSLNIAGHTDNIGGDGENQQLSERRANAVKRALVQRYRIKDSRLSSMGHGESSPKESNATLQGRARNRRVELSRR